MNKHFKSLAVLSLLAFSMSAAAQLTSEISLDVTKEGNIIPKEIYGQFSDSGLVKTPKSLTNKDIGRMCFRH